MPRSAVNCLDLDLGLGLQLASSTRFGKLRVGSHP